MEFPDWPYTQSMNTILDKEMYDQQLHSSGNFIQSSSNWWINPEENFQMTPSMADFSNPGGLDQVFPMQPPPHLDTIQYDGNFNLSSWQNHDPGTQNHLFYIPGEATWETPQHPSIYIPGEATMENLDNPEFSVSNFVSQSDQNANCFQLEPPQFTNCIQSSESCIFPATDALEGYVGISAICSDLDKLVNSMEASKAEFNDIIRLESDLEETLSQISRETNPGGSVVTTINDHSGIVNSLAGNQASDLLPEFLNPEMDFCHVLGDHHPDLKEARWMKPTQLSGTDISEPSSSQNANMEEYSQAETSMISTMKEMRYYAATFNPVNVVCEAMEKDDKPKRKSVRISSDPQTVAARRRRERISERLKVLQKLVPGGGKLDTASMLEEAANYLKFLKAQIKALENLGHRIDNSMTCNPSNLKLSTLPFCHSFPMQNNLSLYQLQNHSHYFHQPQD